jgi:hypothetical protein
MANFNFNPTFPEGIRDTLDARANAVQNRDPYWNYKKYAYFRMSVLPPEPYKDDTASSTSVFDVVTNAKGGFPIGEAPQGGHLNMYTDEGGVRRFKPKISSAKMSLDGGGDLYNSFIREVDISFEVYTLDDLNRVVTEYFRIGARVKIEYGWINSTLDGERGEDIMKVYNFGYSMGSDGSFSCNIKGLTGDAFASAASVGGTLELTNTEEINALGAKGVNPADISMALIAKYKAAFGIDPNEDEDEDENASKVDIDNGQIIESTDASGQYDLFIAAIDNVGASDGFLGIGADDPIRTPFVRFESFIALANKLSGDTTKETFVFSEKNTEIKKNTKEFGSADPRKYIFPGNMADYGEGNEYVKVLGKKDADIRNILVSIDKITSIVKNRGTTVNEKFRPPQMTTIIKDLSDDIKKLSGGLVDIKVVPKTEDASKENKSGQYEILNYFNVAQLKNRAPYEFSVIGDRTIVKDVSIDTEFDIDIMTMMTVGNVRNGVVNLAPFTKSELYSFPDIKIKKDPEPTQPETQDIPSKQGVGMDGIDDSRANSIAYTMREDLVADPKGGSFVTLPFQISLSIKLDGITDIPFLSPITVDRLPIKYKSDGIRFLVMGVEQSFDGNGGWETDIKTAMKIG